MTKSGESAAPPAENVSSPTDPTRTINFVRENGAWKIDLSKSVVS